MTAQAAPAGNSARLGLYALIAALPFTDFLQTGLVAFGAAPIMGELGASPQDYSLVATAYAVVAIGVIANHRWLLERLGWRTLMAASAIALALGALVCAFSGSLLAFGLGRVTMALGCASFMTAGRVLVQHIPPSPRRFTGIKFFAAGLAWGLVAGPLLAAQALALYGWRASFLALLVPAVAIASLAICVLDDQLSLEHTARSQSHPVGLLALMGGSFLLLHGLQQSGFDYFDRPAVLWTGVVLGVGVLSASVLMHGRGVVRPLIRFQALVQSRYLVGLAVFTVAYMVLGANNLMLPVLLQRALGVPLEIVGRFLALGALGSVLTWIVLSRLLPRHPGPTRYYLAGFGALLLCGVQLARLSESANPWSSAMPALLCNGAFVILVLATTAMQTFQTVPQDEATFSHANQVKNMLAQFGVAAGMALATLCLQWRGSVRATGLGESLAAANPVAQQTLDGLTQYFATHGDPGVAPRMALAQLGQWVVQEATFMAALDYFALVAAFACVCLVVVLMQAAVAPLRGRWR
ncbi:MFS transporter [Variovorax sp. H27-G14]|uniref:MFS transporter n=1 Tax=Variovorax sp. H27-G14 TaxID=3111914 RepID=UPI0038FCEE4E